MPVESLREQDASGILLQSGMSSPVEYQNVVPRPHILNGRVQEAYSSQITTFSRVFAIVLLVQLLLLYLYIECDFSASPHAQPFLHAASLTGMAACAVLILRYQCQQPQFELVVDFRESLAGLIFKVAVILLSPYGFLQDVTVAMGSTHPEDPPDQLKLNHLLAVFVFFRSTCFAGVLLSCSYYMQPRANRIHRLFSGTSHAIRTLKCLFKDAPVTFITVCFLGSAILFTFSFRVSEASVYSSSSAGTIYSNMGWMTMVTMTTMGYGDFYPQTMLGRIIGVLCGLWGAFIVSVMVVVLTKTLALDRKESQALRIIVKLKNENELKQAAGDVLRSSLWRMWMNRKCRMRVGPCLTERKLVYRFRAMRRAHRSLSQNSSQFYDDFSRRIEGASSTVAVLAENNLKMVNLLTEEYVFKEEQVKHKFSQHPDLPKIRINLRKK